MSPVVAFLLASHVGGTWAVDEPGVVASVVPKVRAVQVVSAWPVFDAVVWVAIGCSAPGARALAASLADSARKVFGRRYLRGQYPALCCRIVTQYERLRVALAALAWGVPPGRRLFWEVFLAPPFSVRAAVV